MDAILSPLAFFALIAGQCAAVVAVHAMNSLDEGVYPTTSVSLPMQDSTRAVLSGAIPAE